MLASEEKLIQNNLDFLLATAKALQVVRQEGGYGSVTGKVQNGKVVFVTAEIQWHLDKKST